MEKSDKDIPCPFIPKDHISVMNTFSLRKEGIVWRAKAVSRITRKKHIFNYDLNFQILFDISYFGKV